MRSSDDYYKEKDNWLETHSKDVFGNDSFDALQQYIDNGFSETEDVENLSFPQKCSGNGIHDCSMRIDCLADTLRFFRDQKGARDALIEIARKIFRLRYREMEEIFRLDKAGLCRTVKKAERGVRGL